MLCSCRHDTLSPKRSIIVRRTVEAIDPTNHNCAPADAPSPFPSPLALPPGTHPPAPPPPLARLSGRRVRSQLHPPTASFADCLLRRDLDNPAVVQASGIDSAGLTSCLAVGNMVSAIVAET